MYNHGCIQRLPLCVTPQSLDPQNITQEGHEVYPSNRNEILEDSDYLDYPSTLQQNKSICFANSFTCVQIKFPEAITSLTKNISQK
jgi:hypothetical protein